MFLLFSVLGAKVSKIEKFDIDIPLLDEMSLLEYGFNLKVVELPGHTEGSIGLVSNDVFFVGDVLMNMTKPGLSLLYQELFDLFHYGNIISEYEGRKIYFGHGKPVDNRKIWK